MEKYIVVCYVSAKESADGKRHLTLVTRNAFPTRESAEKYAVAIHKRRQARVVECPRGVDFREGRA